MLDLLLHALTEFLLEFVLFPIGWPVMKLITLGKYPTKGSWFSDRVEAQFTIATGLAVIVIAGMAAMKQFVFN